MITEDHFRKLIREEIKNYLEENGGTPDFEPKLVGKFEASSGERSLVLRDKLGRGPHFVILDQRGREVFEMTPEGAKNLAELLGEGFSLIEFGVEE